jgi:hypothetical protein
MRFAALCGFHGCPRSLRENRSVPFSFYSFFPCTLQKTTPNLWLRTIMLSEEKMSEAEVSLRLAFHLLRHNLVVSDVSVAIDGAQIKTLNEYHFHITEFLEQNGCRQCEASVCWSGAYSLGCSHRMIIHSNPGKGDVVAQMKSGHELHVESKKGPLVRSRSSAEYPLLREALGQLITIE